MCALSVIKISKGIGMLYKDRDSFPLKVLKSLYYSLIFSYISYGVVIWYNAPKYATDGVVVLQKKAVRIMNFLNYNEHTSPYFHTMKLPQVKLIFSLSVVIYIYRTIASGDIDECLYSLICSLGEIHNDETRGRELLVIPRFNKEKSKAHIHYRGVNEWNKLPDTVKLITSLKTFKRVAKKYMLGQA